MMANTKVKSRTKAKVNAKPKAAVGAKAAGMPVTKSKSTPNAKAEMKSNPKTKLRVDSMKISKDLSAKSAPMARPITAVVKRIVNPIVERRPVMPRTPRVHQFAYMKAPGIEHEFEVGDTVEVFCDHEKNRDRIRGWIKGIVVQVDNKMVAVQFRSNVFLTDGWMVPDRILWYPLNSEHIRPVPGKKTIKKDFIPDY